MQYTPNYNLSKPEADDIINPASRSGYNGNFDTLDTNLKLVSDKADTNESNIANLQTKTGEDIPFESGSADSISDKITNLDNSVGTKPSSETDTLWDKIGILSNSGTYSTSEQVIGKWIDGKPLYRRTIVQDVTANQTFQKLLTDYGINNANYIAINVGASSQHYGSNIGAQYSPIIYYKSANDYSFANVNASGKLSIENYKSSASTYYITIEYTKTTD